MAAAIDSSLVESEAPPSVATSSPHEHRYKFDVKMTCGGCSGAVTRVLNKAKDEGGVSDFTVNLQTQEVLVKGTLPYDDILDRISKTGKQVRSGVVLEEESDDVINESESLEESE